MEDDGIKPEDLRLSDKLAVERTVLAADRTMLAGVRTSLSFFYRLRFHDFLRVALRA